MATLTPSPKMQFFDANGNPLVGGKLYTYAAGTTTPLATYTDSGAGTPNANPVILDSRGEASVWLGTSLYYMELKTSADVLIWNADNVGGVANQSTLSAFEAALAASGGASLVGFLQSGTGAEARTAQSKMRDIVSVKDFGAVCDGVTDDTNALTLAFAALTDNMELHFPGICYISGSSGAARVPNGLNAPGYSTPTLFSIQNLNNIKFSGPGGITVGGTANLNLLDFVNIDGLELDGLRLIGNRTVPASDILFFAIAGDLIRIRGSGGGFSKNIRIRGCQIGFAPISPIRVMRAVQDCVIEGNNIFECTSTLRIGEDVVGLPVAQRPRRIVVQGNTITNTYADACVEVRYIAQDVVIAGNFLQAYAGDDVFEYVNDNTAGVPAPVHTNGVSIRGGDPTRGYVDNILVEGNTIKAISELGYVARGVTLLDTAGNNMPSNVSIIGNNIDGLVVGYGTNLKISGNRILGNVSKDDVGDAQITDNTITAPAAVTNAIVSNSVANPTVITFSDNHNLTTGNTITISGSNSTPSIDGARTVTVIDKTRVSVAVNVTVGGTAGTATYFNDIKPIFTVPGAYQADIKNNTVFAGSDTTMLTASSDIQTIVGNTLEYTGSLTGNLNAAIRSATGDAVLIEGNTVVNSDGSGIVLASDGGAGSVATIRGNSIKTAANRGVQIFAAVSNASVYIGGNDVGVATNGAYLNQSTSAGVRLQDDNSFPDKIGADVGDAAVTLTVGSSAYTQIYATAITAARAVTLSTTGATKGARFRVVRKATATGAFSVNVGTGPLKALTAAGQWCDVEYDGSAWFLSAYGAL